MPSADVQILGTGSKAAPLDYVLPSGSELILKAVRADFDGTAALGAFLPALEIISDAGHSVGVYPTDVAVAAGASASVSFAPFLRNAPASSGGITPTAFIPYQDAVVLAGDNNPPIVFIAQSVPGVFTQTGAGANPFTINELGTYLFQFSVSVTNPNATDEPILFIFDTANSPNFLSSTPIVLSLVAPAAGKPVAPLYNGSIAGVVSDTASNLCNLIVHCSKTLNIFSPYLVVSQLSTGFA